MSSQPPERPETGKNADRTQAGRHSYLPYLTLALLALMAGWFVKHYVIDRPSTAHQLRVASFDRALQLIKEKYPGDVSEKELYRAVMEAMMERLDGRFSSHLTESERDELKINTRGNYSGIGATLGRGDGHPIILEVKDGSPADKAGLKPEDRLLKADGRDITNLPLSRAVTFIRGKTGTSVELTVQRASSGKTEKISVTRRKIELERVTSSLDDRTDIGTVTLERFGQNISDRIREELLSLKEKGAKALILDLRNNPGGLMQEAVEVVDMFLDSGTIISVSSKDRKQTEKAGPETVVPPEWPVVVLVNQWTASAGEIVAGALKHHGRATVVGTRTLGKGEVNQVFSLPNGSAVALTVAHYRAGGEIDVSGSGIEPDVVAGEMPEKDSIPPERRREVLKTLQEEQMEAGVRVLKEKLNE